MKAKNLAKTFTLSSAVTLGVAILLDVLFATLDAYHVTLADIARFFSLIGGITFIFLVLSGFAWLALLNVRRNHR